MIIDADIVIERMGLGNQDGVADTIDSALTASHVRFQSLLDTTFNVESRSDMFYLAEGKFPIIEDGYFKVRLRKAFVSTEPMVVSSSTELTSTGVTMIQPDWMVNREKGIVFIHAKYANSYILVSYQAGFSPSNPAPEWLKQAVLAYMPFVLNNQQTTNRADEAEGVSKRIADMSGEMVQPYMRGHAFQYRPIFVC